MSAGQPQRVTRRRALLLGRGQPDSRTGYGLAGDPRRHPSGPYEGACWSVPGGKAPRNRNEPTETIHSYEVMP